MECMCRVCETIYGLRNMFDEENEELLLMLRSVANISVSPHDQMPKYICETCSHRLQKTYDFKLQCETTDQKLRDILERLNKSAILDSVKINADEIYEEEIKETKNIIKMETEQIFTKQEPTKPKNETIVIMDSDDEATLDELPNFDESVQGKIEEYVEGSKDKSDDDLSDIDEKEKIFEEEMQKLFGESMIKKRKKQPEMKVKKIEHKNDDSSIYEIVINGDDLDDLIIEDYSEDLTPDVCIQEVHNLVNQADVKNQLIAKDSYPTIIAVKEPCIENPISLVSVQEDKNIVPVIKVEPEIKTPPTFKCPSCPEVFSTKQSMISHRRKHNRWKNKCNICQKYFARKSGLTDHLKIHAGRKVNCDICGQQFSNRGNLLRHISQCHQQIKPYTCDICGTNFARRSSMKIHRSTHSDSREFACEKCGKGFKNQLYLTIHERRHIPKSERVIKPNGRRKAPQTYICPHCGKKSQALPTHLTHMRIHNEIKPFECQECPKKFHFKQTLITHMLIHTGEKPFKCELCGKAFRQQPHLKTHHRCVHLRAKPFQCKYCLKCFSSTGTLKIHERLHTGERPFQCEVCLQRFIEPKGLKKHKQLNRCKGAPPEETSDESRDGTEEKQNDDDTQSHSGDDAGDSTPRENTPEESQEELQYFENALGAELEIYLQDIHNDYGEIIEVESIEADDYLPKHICDLCSAKLQEAHKFIEQCTNTDKKLRETYESIEELISNDDIKENNSTHDSASELSYKSVKKEIDDSTLIYELETYRIGEEVIIEDQSSSDEKEEVDFFYVEEAGLHSEKEDKPSNTNKKIKSEKDDFQINESNDEVEYFESFIVEYAGQSETESSPKNKTKTAPESKSNFSISKSAGQKVFACNSCTETFNNFNQLNAHKKSHGERRFECPTCSKRFSRHYRLRDHMLTHGERLNLPCNLCDKTYTNRGNLERHIRHCHNKEKPHVCEICGWSFARKATLKLHRAVHSDAREFECDKCGKKFKAEYYLNVHKKSHIPIEQRKTRRPKQKRKIQICICPYCGKKSTTQSLHVNHMRTHTGEKPFECPTCSKRFTFKQSLKTHILVHTGEKPFACDICGMTFRQIGHLQGHKLAVHSGLKQHKCLYCDKSFALRSNLTIHERLHTGEKPYECAICGKKFTDTNGLKRHKISHARNNQMEPFKQRPTVEEKREDVKVEESGGLNQLDVSLDQLNVYLDELGNEYTEIIESEGTLETAS